VTRPYTLLSCAVSIDGYLDDASKTRLLLSNEADFDRVDAVRASCDAIMVGAATVRKDNPRLLVRSPERQADRVARGMPPSPTRVTITGRGGLDPSAAFFSQGSTDRLVYAEAAAVPELTARLPTATVVDAGAPVTLDRVLADLTDRGVRRLMVEGGAALLTQFLAHDLGDELHLAIAPVLVGDPTAPRFLQPARFPKHRLHLVSSTPLGDVAVLTYALSERYRAL
jgi:5-amino-6-(5-phosphoribosylamino)uracil reductase